MDEQQRDAMLRVLDEVRSERLRQHATWGEQDLPRAPVAPEHLEVVLHTARERNDGGEPSWDAVVLEELGEALAETAPHRLRAELVQVAAVVVQWIEAIDRQAGAQRTGSHLAPQPPPTAPEPQDDRPVVLERLRELAWDLRPIDISVRAMERLIEDLTARAEQGRQRYGCYLQPHNGRDMLADEYQELIDAAMYRTARILRGEEGLMRGLQRILHTAIEVRAEIEAAKARG